MSYAKKMLDALEAGQMETARQLFTQVLAHDDDETQYNLAEELYALGFNGQAKRLYQGLLGRYPEQGDLATALADIAVSDGDADAALNYLSRIQPDDPAYVQSLISAADVYQSLGLYEVSEQKLLTAKRLAPKEPVVTFALGEFYFDWGHFGQAIAAYNELLAGGTKELAGVNVEARLAASLAQTGQYEDAVAAYEDVGVDALDLNGRFELGGLYLQLHDPAKAIANLQVVIDTDPSYANAYLPLATAYEAQNQPEKALDTVQAGVMVDDTNPDLYALGGKLALSEDNPDLAETYLQKALKIDPEDQGNMLAWSNFLVQEERDQENIDFLSRIDQSGDVDPQIYWNMAKSYDRLDNVKKARENYLLAFNRFQDSPDFLHDLIDFFQSTGARAELKAALVRYLKLVPTDDEMQMRLDDLNDET